ncbi:VWA domain-containing protein, partial [Candidatus Woesearchaeota archaeon]|nr:VWA domain-containing protein [Candidatus Woesearchaeota archaeon]
MLITYPERLYWILAAVVLTYLLIRYDFVPLTDLRDKLRRKRLKKYVFVLRSLVFALLIFALSGPVFEVSSWSSGETSLTLLTDQSDSYSIYDTKQLPGLINSLNSRIPVKTQQLGSEKVSAIGDGILLNLEENTNLLVASDGNANFGSPLSDVLFVAASLNATIHLLDLEQEKDEWAVRLAGPGEVVADVLNEFTVEVDNPRNVNVHVVVEADGRTIYDDITGKQEFTLKQAFSPGFHRMTAKIDALDAFPQNNVYYKAVQAVEKPKLLLASRAESPLSAVLSQLYDLKRGTLDDDLSAYAAVVLDDLPAPGISAKQVDTLSSYLHDGNGLVAVGGKSSYDRGEYQGSYLSTLLPVEIGTGELEEKKLLNVIVMIDVSSGGREPVPFDPHGTGAVEIAKAHAVALIDNFAPQDTVAFTAFDEQVYVLSPLSTMGQKDIGKLRQDIKTLQPSTYPNTLMDVALNTGVSMLTGSQGNNYIIVLSDGGDPGYWAKPMFRIFSVANEHNVKIIAVGSGRTSDCKKFRQENPDGYCFNDITSIVHFKKLRDMAAQTNGLFIPPGDTAERTKSLLIELGIQNKEKRSEQEQYNLMVRDFYHFITEDLDLAASVNGFNFVVPKSSAQLLLMNGVGNPILTVWRFGLGRVAALSTDDGNAWSGELFSQHNSELISRTINWAIGDPSRKQGYSIHIDDTTLNQDAQIRVRSGKIPVAEKINFVKVDENTYTGNAPAP